MSYITELLTPLTSEKSTSLKGRYCTTALVNLCLRQRKCWRFSDQFPTGTDSGILSWHWRTFTIWQFVLG